MTRNRWRDNFNNWTFVDALWTGPQGDGERIKDIAVTGVPEEIEVSAGNRTNVAGLVRAQGVIHRELPIRMRILSSNGNWENGPQDLVRVEKNDQNIPFRLPLTAPENGSFELEVSVPVEDGELLSETIGPSASSMSEKEDLEFSTWKGTDCAKNSFLSHDLWRTIPIFKSTNSGSSRHQIMNGPWI